MDPEIAELIAEETDRGVPLDQRIFSLTILESRGEPRWESDRVAQPQTPESAALEAEADRLLGESP